MRQNLVHNTRQYYEAPIQNQFQTPIVSNNKVKIYKLHGRIMHQPSNAFTSTAATHEKSTGIHYTYTRSWNSKHNAHKSNHRSNLVQTKPKTSKLPLHYETEIIKAQNTPIDRQDLWLLNKHNSEPCFSHKQNAVNG